MITIPALTITRETGREPAVTTAALDPLTARASHAGSGRQVTLLGSPVEGARIDREAVARRLAECADLPRAVAALNGEFLVIVYTAQTKRLEIFNDRFGAYPFFWAAGHSFCGSTHYLSLARAIKHWPGFALTPHSAYEFFRLQRLMGAGTHDTLSRCLPAASHLVVESDGAVHATTYWRPDYTRDEQTTLAARVEEFSALFARSVSTRLAGQQEAGVFLSGGHDSRLVALYADRPVTCYTLGFTDNYEVNCARRIAQAAGQNHVWLKLDEDYFEKTLTLSANISGGMFATDHALFFPVNEDKPRAALYLHGHGLDYMYQGMYLHAKPLRFMGRDTFVRRMTPFPGDLAGHFMDTISFRLKYNLGRLMRADHSAACQDALRASVEGVLKDGQALTDNPSALWDHMIFHQISRHYTFTNVLSKRLCGEVRTPSLDNDLYDFYCRLPDRFRLHADMLRGAMRRKNPAVARIPAGNHALPAGGGPWEKTAILMGRKILRHATGARRYYAPSDSDRTWPERGPYIQSHPAYWRAMTEPLQDRNFADVLPFLDWEVMRREPERILAEPYGGAFWVALQSYYRFYKLLEAA